jgi:hypothetical protein
MLELKAKIAEAKRRLPLPELMEKEGLGERACSRVVGPTIRAHHILHLSSQFHFVVVVWGANEQQSAVLNVGTSELATKKSKQSESEQGKCRPCIGNAYSSRSNADVVEERPCLACQFSLSSMNSPA